MRGFDTKALLLFPRMENYSNKPSNYKYQFKKAVTNLLLYLEEMEIEPYVFYTDDIARALQLDNIHYIKTLSIGDLFFVAKHCDNMSDAMKIQDDTYDDIINAIQSKDPGNIDMSVTQRFELVNRHNTAAVKKIIPQFNIVFHFMFPNRAQYKVTSKPDDGRIRVNINANTFVPTVIFGGKETDPCDVLAIPYGNRALDNWR